MHFTLHTPQPPLHTLHATFPTQHSTFFILHALHSTPFHIPQSTRLLKNICFAKVLYMAAFGFVWFLLFFGENRWCSHSMCKYGESCSTVSHAQVSIGYLLSADFAQLAIQRTGKHDPTFIDACFNLHSSPCQNSTGAENPYVFPKFIQMSSNCEKKCFLWLNQILFRGASLEPTIWKWVYFS